MADGYLRPPATGEVEALSEKHLVNSITGAAVAALLREGKPLTHLGLSDSGKCFDVSRILRTSDGALIAGASLRGLHFELFTWYKGAHIGRVGSGLITKAPVKETRRLRIQRKRFTRSDLLQIGKMFLDDAGKARNEGKRHKVEFMLQCADNTSYTAEDMTHFQEGEQVDVKAVTSVDFDFYNFSDDNYMNFRLRGGPYGEGEAVVRGTDREWISERFLRIQERVEAVSPSHCWFVLHPTITLNIIALGLGVLLAFVTKFPFDWAVKVGFITLEPTPNARRLAAEYPLLISIAILVLYWFSGFLPAMWARDWFLGAWPPVEFDTGPDHSKLAKIKRNRIIVFVTVVILPLGVRVIYDLVKGLL